MLKEDHEIDELGGKLTSVHATPAALIVTQFGVCYPILIKAGFTEGRHVVGGIGATGVVPAGIVGAATVVTVVVVVEATRSASVSTRFLISFYTVFAL